MKFSFTNKNLSGEISGVRQRPEGRSEHERFVTNLAILSTAHRVSRDTLDLWRDSNFKLHQIFAFVINERLTTFPLVQTNHPERCWSKLT